MSLDASPRVLCAFVALASIAMPLGLVRSQEPLAAVAPFLDEHVLVVGHVNLTRLDPAAAVKTLGELAPADDAEFAKRLPAIEEKLKGLLHTFQQAGIDEIYVVVSLADAPQEPIFLVTSVRAGKDAEQARRMVNEFLGANSACAVLHGSVVCAPRPEVIERLRTLRTAARPELAKAFERAGDAAARLVLAPTDDTRRVLREMLPRLPDEVGGGSGKMLVEGLQWAVVAANPPPKLSLDVTIQSKDPDAAAALRGMIASALQLVGKQEQIQQEFPEFPKLAALLTPRVSNDQLRLTLNDKNGGAQEMLKFLTRPVQAARTAAGRMQSMNNMRQLALGLHNYHDVHTRFPPAAGRSKEGKPLLSWRVAILPFLEQQPLYSQFKLDEPWDSEHNRKLIEKMPAVFASPALTAEMRAKGLTSYVAPIAEKSVFAEQGGAKMNQITDGTSNTIALVEAHPKHAVIWTKPEDFEPDLKGDPLAELRGQPNDGFNTVFCDGSARFILTEIDPKLFIHLLQMNDGNVTTAP